MQGIRKRREGGERFQTEKKSSVHSSGFRVKKGRSVTEKPIAGGGGYLIQKNMLLAFLGLLYSVSRLYWFFVRIVTHGILLIFKREIESIFFREIKALIFNLGRELANAKCSRQQQQLCERDLFPLPYCNERYSQVTFRPALSNYYLHNPDYRPSPPFPAKLRGRERAFASFFFHVIYAKSKDLFIFAFSWNSRCPFSGRKERLVCIGRRRKRQRRRRSKNPRMGFLKMFYIFQKKTSVFFCYISLLMQKTDEHCYGDIC